MKEMNSTSFQGLENQKIWKAFGKKEEEEEEVQRDSNAMCACHGEALGHSIEHCRALKRKVQGLIDAG